jgi:aminomethyltransferase
MPIGTPVHERTFALCESLNYREWSGYYAVSTYESHHEHEYNAIRNAAALIDVSPLFKYMVTGVDAARFVDRLITRDVAKMSVGQVFYTPWCDERGKVIDDGTVSRLGEHTFRWTAADPSLRWLRQNAAGLRVTIDDISEEVAALALQGPTSARVLRAASTVDIDALKYFRVATGTIAGMPVDISRTGYTGDLGYEVWIPSTDALKVWDAVWGISRGQGVIPIGMTALYMARIEAGLVLLDVDFHSSRYAWTDADKTTPFELGLGWMLRGLDTDDRAFIGRDAIERELATKSSRWKLSGLVVDWRDYDRIYNAAGLIPPKDHTPVQDEYYVYDDDLNQLGYATSQMYSPMLQRHIALARVPLDRTAPGSRVKLELAVNHRYEYFDAHVARTPLFNPERRTA